MPEPWAPRSRSSAISLGSLQDSRADPSLPSLPTWSMPGLPPSRSRGGPSKRGILMLGLYQHSEMRLPREVTSLPRLGFASCGIWGL